MPTYLLNVAPGDRPFPSEADGQTACDEARRQLTNAATDFLAACAEGDNLAASKLLRVQLADAVIRHDGLADVVPWCLRLMGCTSEQAAAFAWPDDALTYLEWDGDRRAALVIVRAGRRDLWFGVAWDQGALRVLPVKPRVNTRAARLADAFRRRLPPPPPA